MTRIGKRSSNNGSASKTDLRDGLLLAANETEQSTEHSEQSERSANKASTSLGLSLEREDRVKLSQLDEGDDLGADERDGVLKEGTDGLVLLLFLDVLSLLESLLDLVGLLGERLGVLGRVADVDVVEEDVLSHGPEFDTNTTLRALSITSNP